MAYLTVIKGSNVGEQFDLGDKTTIGRARENTIRLGDINASKYHAEILYKDNHYIIFDRNSRNGIVIEGKRIKSHKILQNNDEFRIGITLLRFVKPPTQGEEASAIRKLPQRLQKPVTPTKKLERGLDDKQLFKVFSEINVLLTTPPDKLESALRKILKISIDTASAASGYLFACDQETQQLDVLVSIPQGDLPPMPDSLVAKVVGKKQDVISADLKNDFRLPPSDRAEFLSIRSIICVPILFAKNVRGVLCLTHPLKNQFDFNELKIIKAITHPLGLMLENAQKEVLLSQKAVVPNQLIISSSKEIKSVLSVIEKIAKYPTRILLKGEIGVGKGLFAREIHNRGKVKSMPFVEVNCRMFDNAKEFDIELFGCERGHHPKSEDAHIGKIEQAQNGTLFFNEISEIPIRSQKNLLKFLEARKFRRIGGKIDLKSSAQIISSTSRDLSKAVNEKRFRWDLFFDLNVVQINIPPLRERRADIPALVRYFLHIYSAELNKKIVGISDQALRMLGKYSWHGNVRELENCIERAVMRTKGTIISPNDLILDFAPAKQKSGPREPDLEDIDLAEMSLDEIEKKQIFASLEKHNWDIVKVASILAIHRNTLRRKIVSYALTPSRRSKARRRT